MSPPLSEVKLQLRHEALADKMDIINRTIHITNLTEVTLECSDNLPYFHESNRCTRCRHEKRELSANVAGESRHSNDHYRCRNSGQRIHLQTPVVPTSSWGSFVGAPDAHDMTSARLSRDKEDSK